MKEIFKIIFCLSIMLNFSFSSQKDTATIQYQNLIKQVDKLCEAIVADDYDKAKDMLDKNPNLINLKNSQHKRPLAIFVERNKNMKMYDLLLRYEPELNFEVANHVSFLESFLFDCDISDIDSVKFIDKSIKAGATIEYANYLSSKQKDNKFYMLSYAYALNKHKLFDYLLSYDDTKIDGFLLEFISTAMEYIHGEMKYDYLKKPLNKIYKEKSNDKNYNEFRDNFFNYLDEILKKHNFDIFNEKELNLLIRIFCYIDDKNGIKYLLDRGICSYEKYFQAIKEWAKFYESEKILNLLEEKEK
ncbi:hypothetical protein [Campylobacter corcagiensis]|uniref:Ankyrin repeat domain-containing protein n=1 Tax=Campylobacter corcagiensis TaxID=1448857 RepID=A0A7M1LH40_9BACT|nr:hypothetical protein [Campylobacter corcagiensis]QKF65031.1 hypothetical protein CCORG_1182 [Campylobacter corcagiensis]QOQ86815.1 hypothetical protein IMC76_06250 [Campylobacter corcagiensis]